MKRRFFAIVCIFTTVMALQAQDTIGFADSTYYKNSYGYLKDPHTINNTIYLNGQLLLPYAQYFKRAVDSGSRKVYGLAVTYTSYSPYVEGDSVIPGLEVFWLKLCPGEGLKVCEAGSTLSWDFKQYDVLYNQDSYLLFPRVAGIPTVVDSNTLRKDRWFEYLYSDNTNEIVRSIEIYFNEPMIFDTNYYISTGYSLQQMSESVRWLKSRYRFYPALAADTLCGRKPTI